MTSSPSALDFAGRTAVMGFTARSDVAAAGGVNAAAAAHIVAGVDLLVTSWPYRAPPKDVKVTLGPA